MLSNPVGGAEVRLNAWEARLLPLLGAGPTAKAIAQAATAAGVNMPVEHIQGLLGRLNAAGLLVAPPEPPKPPKAPEPPGAEPPRAESGRPDRAAARTEQNAAHQPQAAGHTPAPAYQEDANERFSEKLAAPLPAQLTGPPAVQAGGAASSPQLEDLRQPEPSRTGLSLGSAQPPTRTRPAVAHPLGTGSQPTTRSQRKHRPKAPPDQPVTRTSPALPLGAVTSSSSRVPGPALEADAEERARSKQKLKLPWLPYAVVAIPVIAALALIPWPWGSTGTCAVEPLDARVVRLPVDVAVSRLLGDEGETVNEGAVIALLDPARLKVDRTQTEAQIKTLAAELERVRKQKSPELDRVRQAADLRSGEMRVALLEFRRLESLQQRKLATDKELEAATTAITLARKALSDAQAELADTRGQVDDELRTREAEVARLRLAAKKLDELIQRPEVTSPITGTIAARAAVPDEGAVVEANELLMEIVQLEQLRAEGRFPQRSLGRVRVGAKVTVRFPGIDRAYDARVERVGSSIEVDHDERFLRVTAVIDNPHRLLRPKTRGTMSTEPDGESVLTALVTRFESLFDR